MEEKKKIGRPTDYTPELLGKVRYYVDGGWKEEGDVIPSIAGLSVYIGKPRKTIYEWASQESKKEFSDILEKILSKQEKELINSGLSGAFNSTITKLVLGKHGYKEQSDVTSDDKPIVGNEITIKNYKAK